MHAQSAQEHALDSTIAETHSLDAARAEKRIAGYNWTALGEELTANGCAVLDRLLSPAQCEAIAASYDDESRFRSHIVMARHGFGRGEYRYYKYPLPDLIQSLRTALYPRLAIVANHWNSSLGLAESFPIAHADYLRLCHNLRPQFRPVVEALADVALEAAFRRIVKGLPAHLFGKIVLARKGVRLVVVVAIARAVAFILHQLGRRVEDVLRRQQRAMLLRGPGRRLEGDIGRVRFRRRGEIDTGLRESEFAFGLPRKS
jgi:hypothetical protein